MRSEILMRVKKVIVEEVFLDLDQSDIDDNANLVTEMGASSIDLVCFQTGLEEEFGSVAKLSESELADLLTPNRIAEYILSKSK